MTNAHKILFGKPKCRRAIGRPRRRCARNITINLRETGCKGVDWIRPAEDRD
jgi:hypothetical protein